MALAPRPAVDVATVLARENGGPIVLQQTDRNVMISKDGRVTVNEGSSVQTESLRGKIRLVRFARPNDLVKEGGSTFRAPANLAAEPIAVPNLHQATLEKSNVSSIVEMSRLIEISRTYQQIAQLLQQQGDMRRSAIQQLAEVPA